MSNKIYRGVNAICVDKPLKFAPISPENQKLIDICCTCDKPACKTGYCEKFKSASMIKTERRNSNVSI